MKLKIKKFDELNIYELYKIIKLRVDVFVVEQNCPYKELDDMDQKSIHLWYEEDGEIKSYLRVFVKDRENNVAAIGRVISYDRGRGLGSLILDEGIKAARSLDADKIYIEAQTYAIDFYKKHGFVEVSEYFLEDGIEHVSMELNLK
ncbi:GNAT family N-acetyltransferase [Peptoniphilus sp. MSJ-1]|uniref:GNAT family N-acetyltransferase n=1 Tax=Peptoniphilus ovalis TaxID=2841503 RepID=A0ABS6FGC8_9FIRM|nr:GNAT family N-acetyltransferase [Peptoniphilus ovalis]MBU5669233.1 GNAT family N-acetyltransferase [Peptoniphilus ovalis]